MRSFIISFVGLATFISLSACSTTRPNENYLDAGARQHIKTVDAVLITKQDRIGADIKRNRKLTEISAMLSPVSILPVLLDAGVSGVRTVNANKMAKPIREKLEGYDYPYEFRNQVRQSLAGGTLDGVDEFRIVRNEHPGTRGRLITGTDADAILVVDMKYGFTANFETLYLQSLAMLFPNHPELKQFQENPDRDDILEFSDNIYRNQFAVGISTQLENATTEEHAAKWAAMSKEDLIEALDVASLLMADQIAGDVGIDDLESDLNLIPEGYALNTKYDNFNQKFASIKSLDSISETPPDESADSDSEADPELDVESEIKAKVVDIKTGS